MELAALVDHILEAGVLTRAEQDQFTLVIMEDGNISEEELAQMQRILELIAIGKIKVVD
ncbi:hypothetical protein [Candidatus Cyanaurora vandensis]|uniref:hypothetical protein n=1 Tax=Candidatus Cyanaurora vandensis TaxID=2714958 RepID=UPI00257F6BB0|nr:hypothetical protein [Candidatus Cyanaurora vandensis]